MTQLEDARKALSLLLQTQALLRDVRPRTNPALMRAIAEAIRDASQEVFDLEQAAGAYMLQRPKETP